MTAADVSSHDDSIPNMVVLILCSFVEMLYAAPDGECKISKKL